MKVSRPPHSSIHRSWDSEEQTQLAVIVKADGVELKHFGSPFSKTEMTVIQLSPDEAAQAADRIHQVLRGERSQNEAGSEIEPQLVISYTTDGEPFREGVSLALSAGNWQRDFDFSMSQSVARELAQSLQLASKD